MDAVYKVAMNQVDIKPIMIKYSNGIEEVVQSLESEIKKVIGNRMNSRWLALKLIDNDTAILNSINKHLSFDLAEKISYNIEFTSSTSSTYDNISKSQALCDEIVASIVALAENICSKTVLFENENYNEFDRKIDNILTSKAFGIPIMIGLLGIVFWITIEGANIPSDIIDRFLFWIESRLTDIYILYNLPHWLHGALVLGMYRTLSWVVSVMLPPMAIFFPLFTLLEDFGYFRE